MTPAAGRRPPTVLVDYGAGNIRSLRAAIERAGARAVVTDRPAQVATAERLMVPGQGAAGPAMGALRDRGLDVAIRHAVAGGSYLLGVCIGLQLLFEHSTEGDTACFGFLPGRVAHLDGVRPLPHMGWNDVVPVGDPHPVTAGFPSVAYFAHSYAVLDAGAATRAVTTVGPVTFASVVAAGRVAGAQFHPERSAEAGLAMITGFLTWSGAVVPGAA